MAGSFKCGTCGKDHAGLPTDWGYQLPDYVWAIPEALRASKAKFDRDLCQYGDRYFIRCVLGMPFTETQGYFGWGLWVEVDLAVFKRYISLFKADATTEPRHACTLANALPFYDAALSASAYIQFRDATSRPSVHLADDDPSSLAEDQRRGIDGNRYHEILAALGIVA